MGALLEITGIVIGVCGFIAGFMMMLFQLLVQVDGYLYVYAQALCLIGALGSFSANENVGFSLNIMCIACIAILSFIVEYLMYF